MEGRFDQYREFSSAKQVYYFVSASTLIRGSSLPAATRRLVEIRVCQVNGSLMCLDMLIKDALHAGETTDRLEMVGGWRHAAVFTAAERAALEFAEQCASRAGTPRGVSDEAWHNAAQLYDEDQLSALLCLIAVVNHWNHLNAAVRRDGEHPLDPC